MPYAQTWVNDPAPTSFKIDKDGPNRRARTKLEAIESYHETRIAISQGWWFLLDHPVRIPMKLLSQTTEQNAALPTRFDVDLGKVSIIIFSSTRLSHMTPYFIQVCDIILNLRCDLAAQKSFSMSLDKILQLHLWETFHALDHDVKIAVYDIRQRHENVTRKKNPILHKEHTNTIGAVAWEVDQPERSLSNLKTQSSFFEDYIWENNLQIPEFSIASLCCCQSLFTFSIK